MNGTPKNFFPFLIAAFVIWRVIIRVRRSLGRQVVTTWRMMLRVGFYAVLTLVITLGLLAATANPALGATPAVFAGLFGGLGLGGILGLVGLRLTQFETTPQGRFYTPNPYMGTAVVILLVARLAYRYTDYIRPVALASETQIKSQYSPLTMLFFGLLAGYYMVYFVGVFLKTRTAVQS